VTPERFHEIEAVFDAVADAPAEERAALLDRLCEGDAELRAEVESLLAASIGATEEIEGAIGREASRVASGAAPAVPRPPFRAGSGLIGWNSGKAGWARSPPSARAASAAAPRSTRPGSTIGP
jgi:hypothetical protein